MIALIVLMVVVSIMSTTTIIIQNRTIKTLQKDVDTKHELSNNTPLRELATDFRNFVKGIDGSISPEVDAAIKRLETTEQQKLLPPKKQEKRPHISIKMWNLFADEINDATDKKECLEVIKRWGDKYIFPLNAQQHIIKSTLPSSRSAVRQYFDKNHNTSVVSTFSIKGDKK